MHTTLISAATLSHLLLSQPAGVRVFDCSFDLAQPHWGQAQFEAAHIPGATHAHLDQHLSAPNGASVALGSAASGGRHPLPSRQAFAQWLGSVGVGNSTQVVVYDRNGVTYAGRLWWMLKWCGHEAVAVLDGGFQAWAAANAAVASGPAPAPAPQHFQLGPPVAALVDTTTVHRRLGTDQTVIDARATPRYRGEVEPLDPLAGHIPGALNRPFASNMGPDGHFKPAAQLRQEFEALLGPRDPASVVHQCGSGVSAVPNLLAMEVAGLGRQALYAGSWSEWSNTPGLPLERG